MPPFNLPLHLESTKSVTALLFAMGDSKVKAGLKKQPDLPPAVSQILALVDDKKFLSKANSLAKKYALLQQGKGSVEKVKAEGKVLHAFLTSRYPEGSQLLHDYGNSIVGGRVSASRGAAAGRGYAPGRGTRPTENTVAINADVVANAEAVVNAAVWANVAAVTNVIVAAEAVVFAAVFIV